MKLKHLIFTLPLLLISATSDLPNFDLTELRFYKKRNLSYGEYKEIERKQPYSQFRIGSAVYPLTKYEIDSFYIDKKNRKGDSLVAYYVDIDVQDIFKSRLYLNTKTKKDDRFTIRSFYLTNFITDINRPKNETKPWGVFKIMLLYSSDKIYHDYYFKNEAPLFLRNAYKNKNYPLKYRINENSPESRQTFLMFVETYTKNGAVTKLYLSDFFNNK